nr:hypothetical protein [Streptomyces marianii]
MPHFSASGLRSALGKSVGSGEDVTSAFEEDGAGLGEAERAALEQGSAQVIFEGADLAAERGLSDV